MVGVEAVVQAASQCWDATNSERIRSYRQQQGLSDSLPLAVLVQQLIGPDVSAVAFSANPVSGNTDQIVINAIWGLGESIVSGTVTPGTYTVNRTSLVLTSSSIADHRHMTVHSEAGAREVIGHDVAIGASSTGDRLSAFRSTRIRSACFPVSNEPISSSKPIACAPSMVAIRRNSHAGITVGSRYLILLNNAVSVTVATSVESRIDRLGSVSASLSRRGYAT